MFCEKCGAQMSDQQVTCEACGWSAQEQAPAVQEAQPIPQYIPVEETPAKKKVWPKIVFPIIAVVVAAMVALAIFQPFGSDKDVIGKWQGDVDLTKAYNEMLANEGVEGVQFHDMRITLILEFNEDHSMTMKYDEASIDKFVEKLLEQRIPAIEQQYDASIDEILAANGLTMESWKQAEFANAKESLQKENEEMMKKDFQWSYSDHKIYLGSERSNYMEVDGDTMHFVMEEETEVPDNELGVSSDAILSLFDNVEFTRVD